MISAKDTTASQIQKSIKHCTCFMNYNEIAQSLYSFMQSLNTAVSNTVGLDVLWFRAVPASKSEDVIFQEYTLLNVECGREMKAVANKTDYNPGALTVDLFGVSYPTDFEVSVDINTWKSVYGDNSMPQKDDIVYVKMMHKLYEVKSSTIAYGIAQQPTSYTVVLCKYNPTASRRENAQLQQSIDDLTVSREELFGDAISNEVADITDPIEFSGYNTTTRDIIKDFEKDSVLEERVEADSNILAEAVYDFMKTTKQISYHRSLEFNNSMYLYFSCWATIGDVKKEEKEYLVSSMGLLDKGKTNTTIFLQAKHKMDVGTKIVLFRGSLLSVEAVVTKVKDKVDGRYEIEMKNSEYLKANKKLSGWVDTSGWKMRVQEVYEYNLISSENDNFNISIRNNKLSMKIGSDTKEVSLPESFNPNVWNYFGIEITPSSSVNIYVRSMYVQNKHILTRTTFVDSIQMRCKDFTSGDFLISNVHANMKMFNIRLFENENMLSETQVILDSQSRNVNNASKIIFVDTPNIDNKMNYIGRLS